MTSTCSGSPAAPGLRTITHLYDSYNEAVTVVNTLEAAGVSEDRISLVAPDPSEPRGVSLEAAGASPAALAPEMARCSPRRLGIAIGALFGGVAGLLAWSSVLGAPGLRLPAAASGWLAAVVIAMLAGLASGLLLGPAIGALLRHAAGRISLGHVRHGATLVSVRTMQAEYDRIEAMMQASRPPDPLSTPAAGRHDDPAAAPPAG